MSAAVHRPPQNAAVFPPNFLPPSLTWHPLPSTPKNQRFPFRFFPNTSLLLRCLLFLLRSGEGTDFVVFFMYDDVCFAGGEKFGFFFFVFSDDLI